ncbi:CRISPR-associated endonuclease Cas2 [Amycolatopsis sp. GA6-003]|uniref:CRISPR-associated endonuclease Cas2 n=1 Tax=Amycolatopsis sp. GA6-003 TaxID=2652444 RepID=UPI0039172516
MARNRYVIAYDIADPVRLRRGCTFMEDHGERLQYSVFLCDLALTERAELESLVTNVIELAQDSIIQIDLERSMPRPRSAPSENHVRCPTSTPKSYDPASGPVRKQHPGTARALVRPGVPLSWTHPEPIHGVCRRPLAGWGSVPGRDP